ncbi:lantibiotic dehydratase [Saccharothrix syringae]|uniref:lantibiotic dehydratase n=1 Tax=Saccharothrix syringae TaxID=103733 RepID=UPI00052644E9|nr:lantibiotic dehydratase [Saccharothrix syringae]
MISAGGRPLYRHTGVALLRAAAAPLTDAPDRWPDLTDIPGCRLWLDRMWSRSGLVEAVRQAGPSLADRVEAIRLGHAVSDRQVRSMTLSVARYVLRGIGRPMPFGLFAGVAPVTVADRTSVRWGGQHRAAVRVNTEWLADITTRAEAVPELLERLEVTVNDLAVRRGDRLEVPHGPNRVAIRHTSVVAAVREAASTPIRFGALVDRLAEDFTADRRRALDTLTELVRRGHLLTGLRAPFTVTDPFAYLIARLRDADARSLPGMTTLLDGLDVVLAELRHHNDDATPPAEQHRLRTTLLDRMRCLSSAGRTPLAADLLLDSDVRVPDGVAQEMERAASALLRTTRHPTGDPAWREYHAAFVDRYGTGTLVPLLDLVSPDAGLGYPARYDGSLLPTPVPAFARRDERLAAMAWRAMADGTREIVLTDDDIAALTSEDFDERYIPPHVELSARVHAAGAAAVDRGEFTLTVAPARSAGTLTSRFTPTATGSGLAEVYRALPAATEGALRAQLSFGPKYAPAENVCRVPAYLDHVIPLGEHRGPGDPATLITVEDLAVAATRDRLHLVSRSRRRVVEPQVFHALALDKQPPPLARFLAELPRAFSASWYQFDWGPHVNLPVLPRVRYGRTVLSPAQWRLTTADLSTGDDWRQLPDRWRRLWDCPDVVELRDADRTLRLTLDEPAHATLLHAHLVRHGQAVLHEATPVADCGWLDHHAHEIALPLVTTRAPAPNPLRGALPEVGNTHGHLPGAPDSRRLTAKIHTHPERMNDIVARHLPELLDDLDEDQGWWFLRYHSPRETHHLRLRLHVDPDHYAACTNALGKWTQRMRQAGVTGRLVLDTYHPEVGRYGHGAALAAAEDVFAADSRLVAALLRNLPATAAHPTALVAAGMVGIVEGFLGGPGEAADWLTARRTRTTAAIDRAVADEAIRLATDRDALRQLPGWMESVEQAWRSRADTLAAYRVQLPADADTDTVLESLLHMHHNRAVGIDSDSEHACRRLARQAALARRARGGSR